MKFLILGAGSIGKRHLANFVEVGVREFTIVDPREDRQQEAQDRARTAYDVLPDSLKTETLRLNFSYNSEAAYADHGPFEAVVIAMPPVDHLAEVERALANTVAIYCEKPLSKDDIDWAETVNLIDRVDAKLTLNMVVYNYRCLPQLRRFRELVQSGVVGQVYTVRGTFSECVRDWHPWEGLSFYMSSKKLGGGALLDESHLIDLCRWIFGDITEVVAFNGTVSSLKDEPIFETDDLVEMMVKFERGFVGSLHMDLFAKYHQKRVEVFGEEGTLIWEFDNSDIESNQIKLWSGRRLQINTENARRLPEIIYPSDGNTRNHMYLEQARYFIDSLRIGKHLRDDVADLRDGLHTMAVLRAARRSAKTKKFESVEHI